MYILLILALATGVLGDGPYSRQYLRGLPEMLRKQAVQQKIHSLYQYIIQPLSQAAVNGQTKYVYSMPDSYRRSIGDLNDELLEGLKEKFPDCAVSYQEGWVKTWPGVKEFKKDILIDWS